MVTCFPQRRLHEVESCSPFFLFFFFFTKGKANAPQRFLLGKHLKNLNIPITEKVYIFLLQPGDLIGWVKWRDVTQKDTWTGRNADVCQSRRTKKCCCYERNRGRGRSWESKLWRPSFLPFGSRHRLLHLFPSREGSAVLGGHFPRTQHPEEGREGLAGHLGMREQWESRRVYVLHQRSALR